MNPRELLHALVAAVEAGRPCALCTVVGTRGSTPQTAGAMLVLEADGRSIGTIGGGCVEAEVRRRALALVQAGSSSLLSFVLNHDYGWDDGLICGGRLDIAVVCYQRVAELGDVHAAIEQIERQQMARLPLRVADEGRTVQYSVNIEPTPTLLIAGAGHVGAALAGLAAGLNFRVVVVDDRADLLGPDRLPAGCVAVAGDIAESLRGWPIDANTYVVIVTRGHAHDEQALNAVIDSPARYLGMIGSRRKVKLIFDDLEQLGVPREKLDRVHSPIGLKIGAVTVPEIAVSIAAELVAVRRSEAFQAVEGPVEIGGPPPQ